MLRVTKTESGMVKGFPGTDARITVFKGIPFAAPTCGDNRWRAPQPPKSWEGVRECFAASWTAAHQASLSFTISQSLLKLMSVELVKS